MPDQDEDMHVPMAVKSTWESIADLMKWIASALIVFSYIGIVVWLLFKLGAEGLIQEKVNLPADGDTPAKTVTTQAFGETAWDQITHLLTALAALVTTAVGVLIGVQIQRASVDSANKRAAKSEIEAQDATKRVNKIKEKAGEIEQKAAASAKEDIAADLNELRMM